MLIAINVLLAAALAGAVALAVIPLNDEAAVEPIAQARRGAGGTVQTVAPLAKYAVIYERDLRGGLGDEPEPDDADVEPQVQTGPMPSFQLLGTAAEPDDGFVMLQTQDGIKMVGVGEEYEGVLIVSVDEESATVKFQGREVKIPRQKPVEGAVAPGGPVPGMPGRMPRNIRVPGQATPPSFQPPQPAQPIPPPPMEPPQEQVAPEDLGNLQGPLPPPGGAE